MHVSEVKPVFLRDIAVWTSAERRLHTTQPNLLQGCLVFCGILPVFSSSYNLDMVVQTLVKDKR